MSFMRPLLFRPQTLGLGLGIGFFATQQFRYKQPIRLDGPSSSILSSNSYRANAKTPVVKENGALNPRAVRQISSGSIIGLCGGLLVSTFSKSLALFLGLMVVGVQWAQSYGVNIIPYSKMQKYVSGIDLRSAVQDNVAFKISFGTTFALAAFMEF